MTAISSRTEALATSTRHLSAARPAPPRELPDPQLLPPEQLRQILRHFSGAQIAFDAAWDAALDLVVWPESRREATEWERALRGTTEGWRASYEGWTPEPRETAVGELVRILSDERRVAA